MIVAALYGVYEMALRTGDEDQLPQRFRAVWLMQLRVVGIADPGVVVDRARARAAGYLAG